MRRDEPKLEPPPRVDRPHEPWSCGHASGENPCHFGPSHHGKCPLADACHPRRTWSGRRRQIIRISIAASLLFGLVLFWPSQQVASIKPGELSTPHAQILASTTQSDRCSSCHEPNLISEIAVVGDPLIDSAHQKSQSQRCLDCHHQTMPRATAMMAHNLPESHREQVRLAAVNSSPKHHLQDGHHWQDWLPSTALDQNDIQCGVCHKEHHGADHDLRFISDIQCQTCHQDRFGSFADSHPDFGSWPYGRAATVSFNHATHAGKHFPQSTGHETFDCKRCHDTTESGEVRRITSYEAACASCHDEGLKLEAAEGLELISLPMLEKSLALRVRNWPQRATGFNEGKLAPIARILLRKDQAVASLLEVFPKSDFSKIEPNSSEETDLAIPLANAITQLLHEVATSGQTALSQRLSSRQGNVSGDLFRSFPPQIVQDAIDKWWLPRPRLSRGVMGDHSVFRSVQHRKNDLLLAVEGDLLGPTEDALLSDDDVLLGDPLAQDDLFDEPIAGGHSSARNRFDADQMMHQGGWYRDDVRLAIRYRGGGHADPVLTQAIEWVATLKPHDTARIDLLASRFAKACLECHQDAIKDHPHGEIQWTASPWVGRLDQFTKFAHGPHLKIASLADCQSCHSISKIPNTSATPAVSVDAIHQGSGFDDPAIACPEFEPMTKGACVRCHQANVAGEACMDCHRYHVRR